MSHDTLEAAVRGRTRREEEDEDEDEAPETPLDEPPPIPIVDPPPDEQPSPPLTTIAQLLNRIVGETRSHQSPGAMRRGSHGPDA
jgi:hypothetical protein